MSTNVLILSSELDGTPLIRDHAIARLLQSAGARVRMLGFSRSGEVWGPLAGDPHLNARPWSTGSALGVWSAAGRLGAYAAGADLLYAMKPRLVSFGLGLRLRQKTGLPLLVDVDDNELGFLSPSLYWEARLHGAGWLGDPVSPLYTRLLLRQLGRAQGTTVTTHWLRERYGGLWVPHTRDRHEFSPEGPADRGGAAEGNAVVLFLGTVRPHKGLELLLRAWRRLAPASAELHIVGTPPDSKHLVPLRELALPSVRFEGNLSFAQVATRLRGADLVCLPQLDMPAAQGQLPTKLVDAMACGVPVVASEVGDLPRWLGGGAGELVPPGDEAALAAAIGRLLDDPARRRALGAAGRERFLELGSREAVRPRLVELVESVLAGRRRQAPWSVP